MTLSHKIAYNTALQVASKAISTALGLISIAIITRHLGQDGFGQYTTIMAFLSFFAISADFGLTLVTVQMISLPNIDQNRILSNLFTLRFLTAAIFLGIAPLVVLFFPYPAIIKIGVSITALSFFFNALNQILTGLFQKHLLMIKVSIAEVVSRIILLIGIIIAVVFHYGLIGIMVATILGNMFSFILHYIFSLPLAKIKFSFDKSIWLEIYKKSWPLAITIAFNLIYLRADTLVLSLVKTQAEVGIYGAAYKVIDVLITIPFMFAGLVLPWLTASWAENNIDQFKKYCQKSFDAMAVLAIPLVVGSQLIAKDIMILIAGEDFAPSGAVLKILIIAAGTIFLGSVFTHGVIAINKQKKIISAYIFTGLTSVIGYIIFIPKFSYLGAAWVTIYSELAIVLASAFLLWKHTRFVPKLSALSKSIFASIIMFLIIQNLPLAINSPILKTFIIVFLATVIYFILMFIFKGFNFFSFKQKSHE